MHISSITRDEFLAGLNLGPQPSVMERMSGSKIETPVEPEKLVKKMREEEWRCLFSYASRNSWEVVDWLNEFVEQDATFVDITCKGTASVARLLRLEFGLGWLQGFATLDPKEVGQTLRQRYTLPQTDKTLHYRNLQAIALRLGHGIEIPPYENFLVEAVGSVAELSPGHFEYAILDGAICLYDVVYRFRDTLRLTPRST